MVSQEGLLSMAFVGPLRGFLSYSSNLFESFDFVNQVLLNVKTSDFTYVTFVIWCGFKSVIPNNTF